MRLTNGHAEALTVPQIWQLACEGDPIAAVLMSEANIALASAMLAGLLLVDAERIILGGTLARCGESWLDAVRVRLAAIAPPTRASDLAARAVLGALGPGAALRGALSLAGHAASGIY